MKSSTTRVLCAALLCGSLCGLIAIQTVFAAPCNKAEDPRDDCSKADTFNCTLRTYDDDDGGWQGHCTSGTDYGGQQNFVYANGTGQPITPVPKIAECSRAITCVLTPFADRAKSGLPLLPPTACATVDTGNTCWKCVRTEGNWTSIDNFRVQACQNEE